MNSACRSRLPRLPRLGGSLASFHEQHKRLTKMWNNCGLGNFASWPWILLAHGVHRKYNLLILLSLPNIQTIFHEPQPWRMALPWQPYCRVNPGNRHAFPELRNLRPKFSRHPETQVWQPGYGPKLRVTRSTGPLWQFGLSKHQGETHTTLKDSTGFVYWEFAKRPTQTRIFSRMPC